MALLLSGQDCAWGRTSLLTRLYASFVPLPITLVPWMKDGGSPAQPESAPWLCAAGQGWLVLGFD